MARDAVAAALPQVVASEIRLADGQDAIVLQVSVDRPVLCPVAIVLDLSDSCPALKSAVEKLFKFLRPLPREWPVWFYRLSSTIPLDDFQATPLGDLLDSSATCHKWLDNARLREQSRWAGSFLRPALEGIESRREDEDLGYALVVVLTDGEILDSEPIDVPDSVRLVGVVPTSAAATDKCWISALPGRMLLGLDDRNLDATILPDNQAFYGWCEISWRWTDGRLVEAREIDEQAAGTKPVSGPVFKCELNEQPKGLLFPIKRSDLKFLRLTVTRPETRRQASLRLMTFGPLNPRLSKALAPDDGGSLDRAPVIVAELGAVDAQFSSVWQCYNHAAALADGRKKWLDGDGNMLVFGNELFRGKCVDHQGRPSHDAMLVLGNREPGPTFDADARVILIGLDRKRQPALSLTAGRPLPFGVPVMSAKINYEKREDCWMLQENAERRELELDGSERLGRPLLKTGENEWVALFSGDLR